jgi:hypothetical protein
VGEQNQPFQLSFNPSSKVDFQGSRITLDSGLLLVRELCRRRLRGGPYENCFTPSANSGMGVRLVPFLNQKGDSRLQKRPSLVRGKKNLWRILAASLLTLIAVAAGTEAALRFGLGLGDPVLIEPDSACSYITHPDQKCLPILRPHVH